MRTHNKLLLATGLAAVAALAVWALEPRPITVELAQVARGAFEQGVADDGRTRVRERYVVHAPLAGRLDRIRLKAGDPVKRGEVVALLSPSVPALLDARSVRELSARVGAAEAQLARSRADLARVSAQREQAKADLERQSRLSREGFVSPAVLEQAELALRTAERTVDAARFGEEAAGHELAQARAALSRYRSGDAGAKWEVLSPVTGAVLKVVQESEGNVALGAALLELADSRSLEAVVDVLSQESVAIRPGMPARIELGRGVAPLAARVRLVEPAAFTKFSALGVEEQRVNVVLDFAEPLDRVRTLGDGFRVEATIVTRRVEGAVKAPLGALFRDGEGWAVFVSEGERAVKRPVRAPQRNGTEALVEEGLTPGEKVVLYPPDALKDGARIRAR
ncbi:MAG: HlyD family efflux transporter periplasmic adaptor subunit [Burkholderiales bacterium]|nr:HlyD family efflux transporter periplasmic adaptor subunit [Burkholderiales bacterium]